LNLGTGKNVNGDEYANDDFEKDDLVNLEAPAVKKDIV
jgi:hypothetical protein